MGKMKESIRLNKQLPFDILYKNPKGARYHQGGNFFNCGGRLVEVDLVMTEKEIPAHVKHKLEKIAQEKEEQASEEVPVGFQCPHCEQPAYKDKNWLDRHIAAKHSDGA